MKTCEGCGRTLPPRDKRKGGRERDYCSNRCRQRAYRARNKVRLSIRTSVHRGTARVFAAAQQEVMRESWQEDLARMQEDLVRKDDLIQLLESEIQRQDAWIDYLAQCGT